MTHWTFIQPNTERQFLTVAAIRASLRSVGRVDCSDNSIGAFCLIDCVLNSLVPANIRNRFAKTMVFDHSFDVQIFKENSVVIFNEKVRDLMSKIGTSVFNSIVNLRNYFALFIAFFRASRLLAQPSLSDAENLFITLKESRIINFNAVAQGAECFQANVNSDATTSRLKNFCCSFNRKASKPFTARITGNRQSFNLSNYCAMKFNFQFSDFRKRQIIIVQTESALSECKRIISKLSLKSWKASRMCQFDSAKETLEGFVESFQNVLQNLRMNFFIFRIGKFYIGKLVGLVVIVERNFIQLVGFSALLQSRVIEKSAKVKRRSEFGCLCLTRKDAQLVCSLYIEFIHFAIANSNSNFGRLGKIVSAISQAVSILSQTKEKPTTQKERAYPSPIAVAFWKWSCANS